MTDNESLLLVPVAQARFARGRSYRISTLPGHNGESKEWSHRSRPLRLRAQPGGAAPRKRGASGGELGGDRGPVTVGDQSLSWRGGCGRNSQRPLPTVGLLRELAEDLQFLGSLAAAEAARLPRNRCEGARSFGRGRVCFPVFVGVVLLLLLL